MVAPCRHHRIVHRTGNRGRRSLARAGIKSDFLRIRAIPFTQEVTDFVRDHERIYVVEMNRDGQLNQLLSLAYANQCVKLTSLARLDGLPMTAHYVEDEININERKYHG
jgi:2-oxoglutarate ferredoxin oxidoreductase subunit alpha